MAKSKSWKDYLSLFLESGFLSALFPIYSLELKLPGLLSAIIVDVIKDKFGISEDKEDDIGRRAQLASQHLNDAGQILSDLQSDLQNKNRDLEGLIVEIDKRQKEAEHWSKIASVDKEVASALTTEIEGRLRTQIQAELNRNKTKRRIFAIVLWVVTLLAGAIAGVAVQEYWNTHKTPPVIEPVKTSGAHNKSLDASGESVFRNLIGPAMLE